jgi:hypothetical protein
MRERRDEDEMRERSKYCVRRREVVKALHSLQVRCLEGLGGVVEDGCVRGIWDEYSVGWCWRGRVAEVVVGREGFVLVLVVGEGEVQEGGVGVRW